jgi:hypothetical protein
MIPRLKEIKKILNRKPFDGEDFDTIKMIFHELERNGSITFQYMSRHDNESSDCTQIGYYSEKIAKTIIWDYEATDYFETVEELAEYAETTQYEIEQFERSLPDISPVAHI